MNHRLILAVFASTLAFYMPAFASRGKPIEEFSTLTARWKVYEAQCKHSQRNCWALEQVEAEIKMSYPDAVLGLCDVGPKWFANGRAAMKYGCQLP